MIQLHSQHIYQSLINSDEFPVMSDASHRHRPRPETRATISWSRPASSLTHCTSVSPPTATAVIISLWTHHRSSFSTRDGKKMSILQFTTAPFYRTKFDWFIYFFAASVSVERCRLISYSYQVTEEEEIVKRLQSIEYTISVKSDIPLKWRRSK